MSPDAEISLQLIKEVIPDRPSNVDNDGGH